MSFYIDQLVQPLILPNTLISLSTRHRSSAISYQSPAISYKLSVINYKL
jgi:hypothetical protein